MIRERDIRIEESHQQGFDDHLRVSVSFAVRVSSATRRHTDPLELQALLANEVERQVFREAWDSLSELHQAIIELVRCTQLDPGQVNLLERLREAIDNVERELRVERTNQPSPAPLAEEAQ